MQWINRDLCRDFPGCYLVAEDLQTNNWLTKPEDQGGAGFTAQWDAAFVHPIREVIEQVDDMHRDMWAVRDALCHRYNNDAFQRVVYSESHDEVANGKSRVPSEINPDNPEGYFAKKRSMLALAMALTAPGVPMLFQGQELLQDEWFRDTEPLAWEKGQRLSGLQRLVADLIHLRLNRDGSTTGLTGQHIDIRHVNEMDKIIAFLRCGDNDSDQVMVVANFADRDWTDYEIGFPTSGRWHLRLNSDWTGYDEDFSDHPSEHVDAYDQPRDGFPASGKMKIGPYSVLIFSK